MVETLYVTNTAGTPTTITGSDVAISTINIKPNQYNNCRISAFVEISTTGTSATTNNTIKIKLNGTLLTGATFNYRTDAVVRTVPLGLEWIGDLSQGGALTITIAGAGADAQTTMTVKRVYVLGLQ